MKVIAGLGATYTVRAVGEVWRNQMYLELSDGTTRAPIKTYVRANDTTVLA